MTDEEKFRLLKEWMQRVETKGQVSNQLANDMTRNVFRQLRTRIANGDSFAELWKFVGDSYDKMVKGNRIVGPHLAAGSYKQVWDKMWSIDNKAKKENR